MQTHPSSHEDREPPPAVGDSPEEIARDLHAVAILDAVPTLLDVLCESTGLRFAAVARVTDNRWIACAVKDDIDFGLQPGSELDVNSSLCIESPKANAPIVIEQASADVTYRDHPTPRLFGFESYVSVPIVMPNGRYFGNLCAIDPSPRQLSHPRILSMFTRFAKLIGQQLAHELAREQQQTALLDERAASELREQFIAILGHDLRNPLQAVHATSELLARRLVDPDLIGMAMRIRTCARRMSALLDDVLDFARGRLGSGIGVDLREEDDIAGYLTAVVRELQDAQPNRQIITNISVSAKVHCDVGRVQQMASNLVANALTHGSAQGSIHVSASSDEECLTFGVWNDGEPIPAASIGKVFEPFWRHSVSASRHGLGLGLYICSQIVSAHKGWLSVTSTKEAGTNFVARLPLRQTRTSQYHVTPISRASHTNGHNAHA